MSSVPRRLRSEDRQKCASWILSERCAPPLPARKLAAVGERLSPETAAHHGAERRRNHHAAAAAAECRRYVKVREELRRPASSTRRPSTRPAPLEPGGVDAMGLATTLGRRLPRLRVPSPSPPSSPPSSPARPRRYSCSWVTSSRCSPPEPAFAQTMLTAGWVFGAMTAAAILVAAIGLLLTALRNRPTFDADLRRIGRRGGPGREAWHDALLERGILPFLQEALAAPGTAARRRTTPSAPSRMPHLGYDRPGFSSPDDGPEPGHRPRFSSPDFSSPDFGGPSTRRSSPSACAPAQGSASRRPELNSLSSLNSANYLRCGPFPRGRGCGRVPVRDGRAPVRQGPTGEFDRRAACT
ncbi:hypothetical protein ACRAWF_42505 [Streptomyces sp. L7]